MLYLKSLVPERMSRGVGMIDFPDPLFNTRYGRMLQFVLWWLEETNGLGDPPAAP